MIQLWFWFVSQVVGKQRKQTKARCIDILMLYIPAIFEVISFLPPRIDNIRYPCDVLRALAKKRFVSGSSPLKFPLFLRKKFFTSKPGEDEAIFCTNTCFLSHFSVGAVGFTHHLPSCFWKRLSRRWVTP